MNYLIKIRHSTHNAAPFPPSAGPARRRRHPPHEPPERAPFPTMKKPKKPEPPRNPSQARAHIVKSLRQFAHSTSLRQLWDDWLEGMALAFANFSGNSMEMLRDEAWKEREAKYMRLVERHGPERWREIAALTGVLVDMLEEQQAVGIVQTSGWSGGGDPLGELFMELEFGNEDAGQFFTPWSLCVVKARLLIDEGLCQQVDELGFVTIEDPAVGSGTTLLAAADQALELGVNPQTQMRFHGRDISLSSVHMAYVNLSLRGLPGIIEHGDTLRMEIWSRWVTPMFLMGGWKYRRQRQPETSPRELLRAAVGHDLPDALLVLRVRDLPDPGSAVRAAAEAVAADEAEDAGPEEFA
jgi:hypothetical protein